MIPASKATLASTIPGPPRAFVVIERFRRSNPRNPANRPARDTETIFTTQLPTRNAANQIELQSHNREVHRHKKRERNLSDRVERLCKQPALLMHHSEPRQKRCKDHADIERPRDDAISQ